MTLALELGGNAAPYVIRVRSNVKAGSGIWQFYQEADEAQRNIVDLAAAAKKAGWRLGAQTNTRFLQQLPVPPQDVASPNIEPRRGGRKRKNAA